MDEKTGKIRLAAAALIAAALLVSALLSVLAALYMARVTWNTEAAVAAAVSQRYPGAEADAVRALQSAGRTGPADGAAILKRYGMTGAGLGGSGVSTALLRFLLPGELLFTLALCAGFVIFLTGSRRRTNDRCDRLTDYIRHVRAGDYSLDLRDNCEGRFSILKNEIYKVTVTLREQAETLRQEKICLAASLADISHQIRTPLTSLFVLADLLADDPPEPARGEFVERIRRQLARIQWLVSTLLKLSRLDTGTAELKRERVLLRDLAARAAEPLQIPADIRDVRLTSGGDERAAFMGDRNWSAEALGNVVKNCIEHTGAGGTVAIAYAENPLYSEITVSDTGEGIAPEDLPHIFTRFYRGKNADENSVGIGLAMARAVFRAQGGDITAQSRPGRGTRFSVRFYKGVF